jgi:hypothetical protein
MSTKNQGLDGVSYQKQFKEILQAVFGVESYFTDFFAGGIEALDGVQNNAVAFSVKTSDIPVVVGAAYDTDSDVAFGSGTGKSSRFGERTEIIYTDTDVPYTWGWRFHEGIDTFTVNNTVTKAVADRLEIQARAKMNLFNKQHGKFIATSAGKTESLASYTEADVIALFDALASYFINIKAVGSKVAKITANLFNTLVNSGLTTNGKNSTINIDGNILPAFKGFGLQAIPDENLMSGTPQYAAYAYVTGIGKAFTGINTARAIPSEDFEGVALQGAGKAGEFIIADNCKAIVKVTAPAAI